MAKLPFLVLLAAASSLACVPSSVKDLATTEVSSSMIKVKWAEPLPEEGQSCFKQYSVGWNPDDHSKYYYFIDEVNTTEHTITDGLRSCQNYIISVEVLGENDEKSPPTYVTATTAPRSVNNLSVARKSNTSIAAKWEYDLQDGGSCATQFRVSICDGYYTNCISKDVDVTSSNPSYKTYFEKSITDCNAYSLQIVALGNQGQSDVNKLLKGAPLANGSPENVTISSTSNSLGLKWDIPDSQKDCENFVHIVTSNKDTEFRINNSTEIGSTEFNVTNLASCTIYEVQLWFESSEHPGAVVIPAYTLPQEENLPDFKTDEATSNSLTVKWASSDSTLDQCVKSYKVCWRKQSSKESTCRLVEKTRNDYQITDLEGKTDYLIEIHAVLQDGSSFHKETLDDETK